MASVTSRGLGPLVAMSVLVCALTWSATASAEIFTWSGKASSSSLGWSNASNWRGAVAPSASSTVSLSFPLLGSGCSAEPPTEACYESTDDVSGLTAESIDLTDGGEYEIEGTNSITLGSGGLTSQPEGTQSGYAVLALPLTLGATQTWDLAGSSRESLANHLFLLEGEVKGAGSRLTVAAEKSVEFAIGADVNVGTVNIEGAVASGDRDSNAIVGLGGGGSLNWSDENPVRLAHVLFFGSGKVGPLSTEGTTLVVGSEEAKPGVIEADGVTLDPETAAEFEARSVGDVVGTDYSQLNSAGAVSLNSAVLAMVVPKVEGESCSLAAGSTYTLISTTGELTGSFGNAPEGSEIPVTFAKACGSIPAQQLKIAYHRSGATKTVTATVVTDSTTSLSLSPEAPVSDQPVTLTATVSADGVEPAGTVSFQNGGTSLPGCSEAAVTLEGSSYIASCQTSFLAAGSPENLSATYTPASSAAVIGSGSTPKIISVGLAATSTTLSASSLTPVTGQQVSYTATVVQGIAPTLTGPTGSVSLQDGAQPIGSCTSLPLSVGTGSSTSSTCTVTYATAGQHTITAHYLGDQNFSASISGVVTVTVAAASGGKQGSQEQGQDSKEQGTPKAGSGHQRGVVKLLSHTLKLRDGAGNVDLRCEGGGSCEGELRLTEQVSIRAHGKLRRRTVVIGSARYSISVGHKATVHMKIDSAGLAALRRVGGNLAATLSTTSPNAVLGKVHLKR